MAPKFKLVNNYGRQVGTAYTIGWARHSAIRMYDYEYFVDVYASTDTQCGNPLTFSPSVEPDISPASDLPF